MQSPTTFFERLEARRLFAVQTLDFSEYPVTLDQLNFLTPNMHTPTSGFGYALGTGNGQRHNANGVTWPDASYYEAVLGTGGFSAIDAWKMRPAIIYTVVKPGGWQNNGWNHFQDMAEGAACVDDAARVAVTYADQYLFNNDPVAFQRAKDVLNFVGYLTTREGKTYNFAWLDAPTYFTSTPQQSADAHFMYRVEYNKRTAYPSDEPSAQWSDPLAVPSQIVGGGGNPKAAIGFRSHPKYSIYMNDLRDANNADVATVYDGPLYNALGNPVGAKAGIKNTQTTSTQQFGMDEARAIHGFVRVLAMLQKFASVNGGLIGDNLYFAKYSENHLNRLLRNFRTYLNANTGVDSKLLSVGLAALADYRQLTSTANGLGNGHYSFRLAANSNTPESGDDRVANSDLDSMIDTAAAGIQSRLLRTTPADWRNGIFIHDANAGDWDAWGELQIFALARAYGMKRAMGMADAQVASLLDDATYAADEFYGKQGWHYKDEAAPNLANTRQRITSIRNWTASYHTNSNQTSFYNSSIVVGLDELARAWSGSGRLGAATRQATYHEYMRRVGSWFIGNNSQLAVVYDAQSTDDGAFQGIGATFDGLGFGSPPSVSNINRNSGAEANAEALWAWIRMKKAIADFGLSNIIRFENGLATTVGADGPIDANQIPTHTRVFSAATRIGLIERDEEVALLPLSR